MRYSVLEILTSLGHQLAVSQGCQLGLWLGARPTFLDSPCAYLGSAQRRPAWGEHMLDSCATALGYSPASASVSSSDVHSSIDSGILDFELFLERGPFDKSWNPVLPLNGETFPSFHVCRRRLVSSVFMFCSGYSTQDE